MTRMQDDLDERGNLWREFVGLVGDWFAEADFQPLSENHRDVLMAKHEAVLQFGAQKLHADDSHTSENFLAAVVTKDMSRCQRLWQPLVKQIAANHKMIADGIKPPTGPPADPEPDLTKPDSDSVANGGKANRRRKTPATEDQEDWEEVYRDYEKSNLKGDRKAQKKGDWPRKFQAFYESRKDLHGWTMEVIWKNIEAARKRIVRRS